MNDSQVRSRKFTIQERLNNLPWSQRPKSRKDILSLLEVSTSTLYRILNAKPTDKQELSSTNLFRISNYFNCAPKDIFSEPEDLSGMLPDVTKRTN